MSETLSYEFAHDLLVDIDVPEFDNQVPEYINPDWEDDALFNLISSNQDVLVDVNGCTMTLSAAMNEHPGPWIPENEANLIAYAEGLLVSALIEPAQIEEAEAPEDADNMQPLDVPQHEDAPILEVEPQVLAEIKLEKPMVPSEPMTSINHRIGVKVYKNVVNGSAKSESKEDNLHSRIEPNPRVDSTEQVSKMPQPIKTEDVQIHDLHQSTEQSSAEAPERADTTEATKELHIESDMVVNDLELADEGKVVSEVIVDELVELQSTENDNEAQYDIPETWAFEMPSEPAAEFVGIDQEEAAELDAPASIHTVAEEVESAIVQLTELIGSDEPEDAEAITVILNKIFDAPTSLDITTNDELQLFYTELFAAAGVTYSFELVETLSALTMARDLVYEIERIDSARFDISSAEDAQARAIVRKLLIAFINIIRSIRHVFMIGTYALRLSVAPKVDYQWRLQVS